MTDNGSRPSDEVARFAAGTGPSDLSDDALERAKRSVLDLLGCAALGSMAESVEPLLRYVRRRGGPPDSAIFFGGGHAPATEAALVNGAFVHSTEMSETFTRALAHPGNAVLPALLAVAERDHLSGRSVLVATAVGYEILIRLGLGAGPDLVLEQGLHPPATMGVFGATAALANARGFSVDETADALGIASCHAPSALIAAMYEHATVKDLFQAWAAATAVMATDLAAEGMSGPRDWLSAWTSAVPRHFDIDKVVERLGTEWWISSGGLHFKRLPVMAMGAPTIGALRNLIAEQGPPPISDIESIKVESSGRIELGRTGHPTNAVAARASLPFLTAAVLVHPDRALEDEYLVDFFTPELLADEAVRSLASRVQLAVDEEFEHNMEVAWPMKFEARVTISLRDGGALVGYKDTWPETSTMSFDEVADKFRAVSKQAVEPDRTTEIIEAVRALDACDDIADFAALVS